MARPSPRTPLGARFPFHPFLFALYPIAALLASNRAQVGLAAGAMAAVVSNRRRRGSDLRLSALLRDRDRGPALSSLVLVAFFSDGHAYETLRAIEGLSWLGRYRTLIPAFSLAVAAGAVVLGRMHSGRPLTQALQLTSVVPIVMLLLQVGLRQIRQVLRTAFGFDLPDLPDVSFHSNYDAPFWFTPVDVECPVD